MSEAEFIAIDLEFTGLSSGGRDLEALPFDTPRQYYEKVYQRALEFLPLQLGACIFQYDKEKERSVKKKLMKIKGIFVVAKLEILCLFLGTHIKLSISFSFHSQN